MKTNFENQDRQEFRHPKRHSKKQMIIELWMDGHRNIWRLAEELQTQPSYIASTLQAAGLISGYYDLYTTPSRPFNIYFSELQGKMGFKDVRTALFSVDVLEGVYRRFADRHDRAGQHHCLATALTMLNRARFSGKTEEAKIFKAWLFRKLSENDQALRH